MAKPSPAEILRFIATEESLEETLIAFPNVGRSELRELLLAVAHDAHHREERHFPEGRQLGLAWEPTAEPPAPMPVPQRALPLEVVPTGLHPRLRVYSDGAARGNPGPAGAGAVLMTSDGTVIERIGRYLGRQTNNVAEYQGLLLGLSKALELGAREVEVMADSELMIRQLQGRYKVKSPNLIRLWEEASALLSRFDKVRLVHVLREHNKDADEMSNRAIDERM